MNDFGVTWCFGDFVAECKIKTFQILNTKTRNP